MKILTSDIDWGIANLTVCQKSVWLVEFEILLYFDSLSVVTSCQAVIEDFCFRNWLRDSKSNCMQKLSLIGWVWNSALFWQLISCYKLSSCHKILLTSEIDWRIANLTVCQKSVWLVEFEILHYFDSFSVVTCCEAVKIYFLLHKFIQGLSI